MKQYFIRLKSHPGLGVATILTFSGAFAGAANKSAPPLIGALLGALFVGGLAWSAVLISNRK